MLGAEFGIVFSRLRIVQQEMKKPVILLGLQPMKTCVGRVEAEVGIPSHDMIERRPLRELCDVVTNAIAMT